jgi:hypothetical protein
MVLPFSIFLLGGTLPINLYNRPITKTFERWDGRLKMKIRLKMRDKIGEESLDQCDVYYA